MDNICFCHPTADIYQLGFKQGPEYEWGVQKLGAHPQTLAFWMFVHWRGISQICHSSNISSGFLKEACGKKLVHGLDIHFSLHPPKDYFNCHNSPHFAFKDLLKNEGFSLFSCLFLWFFTSFSYSLPNCSILVSSSLFRGVWYS